ncbi:wax ester/triacylglycerol synthase domain-containing protein [Rhodococcus sp. RD6.2]|uniref:wax ester/triacylglycerol synthase domain-containing protein n=1 Tax=Rhodococcus sp. RD6.2 TaxID=260936 RepID=UPI00155D908F|nr:wax ester/triacylglycerol synthase domain-containing protein [Rhodococcus sp. RD6.2]
MNSPASTRLASRDTWFLLSDELDRDDAPSVHTGVYVFDTSCDQNPIQTRADAVDWMRQRMDRAAILRQRVRRVPGDLGHPYWVPASDTNPDDHVQFRVIGEISREDFYDIFATMTEKPFGLDRAPWEVHVLTDVCGVEDLPDRATVVAVRVHHAATDGLGSVQIARALFDDPDASPAVTGTPGPVRGAAGSLLRLPGQFGGLARSLRQSAAARKAFARLVESGEVTTPKAQRPRTRFNDEQSGQHVLGRVKLSLAEVRAIARATGTSINDVILTIISGGLATFLSEAGETPNDSLAAQVPRAIRDGHAEVTAANKLTTMFVDLHTDEHDPLARLKQIHESADFEKHRVQQPESIAMEVTLDHAPAIYLKSAMRLAARGNAKRAKAKKAAGQVPLANTLVSNVPRGRANLKFGDSPVVDSFCAPMIHRGNSLAHGVTSIGDVLSVQFTSDDAMMPDPLVYERALGFAFGELKIAVSRKLPERSAAH